MWPDRSQTAVYFPLYATVKEGALYTCEPGMRRVAAVELDLPPGWSVGLACSDDYKLRVCSGNSGCVTICRAGIALHGI